MPWAPKINALKLKQRADELTAKLIRAQADLQTSNRHRAGLKIALAVREKRIDALTVKIDQLREQNRRLDAEAERLAEMLQFSPPPDAAMPAK